MNSLYQRVDREASGKGDVSDALDGRRHGSQRASIRGNYRQQASRGDRFRRCGRPDPPCCVRQEWDLPLHFANKAPPGGYARPPRPLARNAPSPLIPSPLGSAPDPQTATAAPRVRPHPDVAQGCAIPPSFATPGQFQLCPTNVSLPLWAPMNRGIRVHARRYANRGRTAEQMLAPTHTAYRQGGTALMVPVPPPKRG